MSILNKSLLSKSSRFKIHPFFASKMFAEGHEEKELKIKRAEEEYRAGGHECRLSSGKQSCLNSTAAVTPHSSFMVREFLLRQLPQPW